MSLENILTLQENSFFEFESLLDDTCTRLQQKQAQYSIRRLQELDVILGDLERELDMIIALLPQADK